MSFHVSLGRVGGSWFFLVDSRSWNVMGMRGSQSRRHARLNVLAVFGAKEHGYSRYA